MIGHDLLYQLLDTFFRIVFWYGSVSYTIIFLAAVLTDHKPKDKYSRMLGTLVWFASISWMLNT